jgi:small subunit ribosomal protein S20
MANTSAAKKAAKQSEKNRLANKSRSSTIKTVFRKFNESVEKSDLDTGKVLFVKYQSLLAKAAKKGLFHWKKTARLTAKASLKLSKAA